MGTHSGIATLGRRCTHGCIAQRTAGWQEGCMGTTLKPWSLQGTFVLSSVLAACSRSSIMFLLIYQSEVSLAPLLPAGSMLPSSQPSLELGIFAQ